MLRKGSRFGSRDDDATRLAAHLNHFLPYDTALAILELWITRYDQRPGDPFGLDQVRTKLDSAAARLT